MLKITYLDLYPMPTRIAIGYILCRHCGTEQYSVRIHHTHLAASVSTRPAVDSVGTTSSVVGTHVAKIKLEPCFGKRLIVTLSTG